MGIANEIGTHTNTVFLDSGHHHRDVCVRAILEFNLYGLLSEKKGGTFISS